MALGGEGGGGWGGSHIELLHLVSSYVPRMGLPETPWDKLSFASKGGVTCGSIVCANWQTSSLHHIGSTVHVLIGLDIDASLAFDPYTDLLGLFTATNVDVEALRVSKTIYLPAPFVGFFLERDLTPMETCTHIHSAIMNAGQEVFFGLSWIGSGSH